MFVHMSWKIHVLLTQPKRVLRNQAINLFLRFIWGIKRSLTKCLYSYLNKLFTSIFQHFRNARYRKQTGFSGVGCKTDIFFPSRGYFTHDLLVSKTYFCLPIVKSIYKPLQIEVAFSTCRSIVVSLFVQIPQHRPLSEQMAERTISGPITYNLTNREERL